MSTFDQKAILKHALRHLQQGKILAFPTDTVYGLGTALYASNEEAMYTLKKRERNKPLVVYVNSISEIEKVTLSALSEQEFLLAEQLLPGPFTLLLNHKNPDFPHEKLGFRILSLPILQQLIHALGPLLGTSANVSNFYPAVTMEEVREDFPNEEIFIIPGQCTYGLESTILSAEPLILYREGVVSKRELEKKIRRTIPVSYTQKPPCLTRIKIDSVKNHDALEAFLSQHPTYQGMIIEDIRPIDFYPTLRKAFKMNVHSIIFIYDIETTLYPELASYLLPYT